MCSNSGLAATAAPTTVAQQVHDLLDPRRVRDLGIFAPEFVDWLLREFYGGSKDLTIQLYQVFLLERWMELFVDRAREVPA